MRVRTIAVTAGVVSAGLALFVATGFGDDEADLRSFDAAYSTPRAEVKRSVWLTNLAAIESISGRHKQAAHTVERLLGLRVLPDLHRSVGYQQDLAVCAL